MLWRQLPALPELSSLTLLIHSCTSS
uniref:Uncharacterized protein n=1 Tax=Arundo donax TaxID=35708 RepID=A0A0A9EM01_ARUDO